MNTAIIAMMCALGISNQAERGSIQDFHRLGEDIEYSMSEFSGLSIGYSYRGWMFVGGPLERDLLFLHTASFSFVGNVEDQENKGSSFGSLGVIVGFNSGMPSTSFVGEPLFQDGQRLVGTTDGKSFTLIGGKVRFFLPQNRHSGSSLSASMPYIDLEMGLYTPTFASVRGALNVYEAQEKKVQGFYMLLNFGGKLTILDLYGGIGFAPEFFTKGYEFDAPKDEVIDNPPKTTNHLLVNFGIGLTFDFYKATDH